MGRGLAVPDLETWQRWPPPAERSFFMMRARTAHLLIAALSFGTNRLHPTYHHLNRASPRLLSSLRVVPVAHYICESTLALLREPKLESVFFK